MLLAVDASTPTAFHASTVGTLWQLPAHAFSTSSLVYEDVGVVGEFESELFDAAGALDASLLVAVLGVVLQPASANMPNTSTAAAPLKRACIIFGSFMVLSRLLALLVWYGYCSMKVYCDRNDRSLAYRSLNFFATSLPVPLRFRRRCNRNLRRSPGRLLRRYTESTRCRRPCRRRRGLR